MRSNLVCSRVKRYLTDVLTRIVNGHPNSDIDQLLPWAYRRQALKAVA
jgi:transposase